MEHIEIGNRNSSRFQRADWGVVRGRRDPSISPLASATPPARRGTLEQTVADSDPYLNHLTGASVSAGT